MRLTTLGELLVPGIIVVYVVLYVAQTYHLPADTIIFPYAVIGFSFILLSLFVLRIVRESRLRFYEEEKERLTIKGVLHFCNENRRAIAVTLLAALYVYALSWLGFFFTTVLFLCALFHLFRTLPAAVFLPGIIILTGALHYLTYYVLRLAFPSFAFADLPYGI
jgi:hypothetical protein